MGLEKYHQKRDFAQTPEPKGETHAANGFSFVIQKHAATRLHYDFRLELDGVLLSWAVPKGPSLDPAVKRLAMQTEDHPIEYGTFEGVIPKGEYGGGTVLVWDRGTWVPEEDPHFGYKKGHLKFALLGHKLRGSWHLVRTKGRDEKEAKHGWLLFKQSDDEARPGSGSAIVDDNPESALTGRTLEQIKEDPDRIWHSKEEGQKRKKGAVELDVTKVKGARKAKLAKTIEPQLATLVSEPPAGGDWIHEIKLDGYRLVSRLDNGKVQILTRRGNDWTKKIPSIARALSALPVDRAIFDGEICVLEPNGKTSFQLLQNSLSEGGDEACVYFVFDLLHLGEHDLTGVKLDERKALLRSLLLRIGATEARIRYSDHMEGSGAEVFAKACELGLEGIISKRRDCAYVHGRTRDWLKIKCTGRQEFLICGFTDPGGSRSKFGALLLGWHDRDGNLLYCGRVGTGFTERSLAEVHKALAPLEQKTPPFANPPRGADAKGVHWVKPRVVCEVEFTEITHEGLLRHPSFQGLRQDKAPEEIVRERAKPTEQVTKDVAASKKKSSTKKSPTTTKTAPKKTPAKKKATSKKTPTKKTPSQRDRVFAFPESFHLSNPDRVFYREDKITKAEVARYYIDVAEWILPHLVDRPLTLVRCPEGYDKQCFYQKQIKDGTPPQIHPIDVGEDNPYMAIDDIAGLLGLVQLGTLEIHTWGAHADAPDKPDYVTFDLDPDESIPWERVIQGALRVRERLEELGLQSFLKTTGGKGLHVVLPIERRIGWDELKQFCKAVAESIVEREPDKYLATMSKAQRKGKIFVDYLRNGRGATAIAAYSTRARKGATVSTPIDWAELTPKLKPADFNVRTLPKRLASLRRDPWQDFFDVKQAITRAMQKEAGAI